MKPNHLYLLWLTDVGARAFLGWPPPGEGNRWVLGGEFLEPEPIGIWVRVIHVEQWTADDKRVLYDVSPECCLVRWDFIISAQAVDSVEALKDPHPIGFHPAAAVPGRGSGAP